MHRKRDTFILFVTDFIIAALAWSLFYGYRKYWIESPTFGYSVGYMDRNFYLGILLIPAFWIALYAIAGFYNDIYRKSRLNEVGKLLFVTVVGVLLLFFLVILDDVIVSYKTYYGHFLVLFLLQFMLALVSRMLLLSNIAGRLKSGKITFNTLMIGGAQSAIDLYEEMVIKRKPLGNKFVGFVNPNGPNTTYGLEQYLPCLGSLTDIPDLVAKEGIEEVIIALDTHEHDKFRKILSYLQGSNLIVKIIPDMYDIMIGSVKMQSIFGTILIEIYPEIMPQWQQFLKRIIDITVSLLAIILLLPLFIFIAIKVKLSSKGPIFYTQERIGKNGKPFQIYKYRSMIVEAEAEGPALSSEHDPRITKWGRTMRKLRLDEFPQFYNVILGQMSLVGPRPERKYYIDQIMEQAPHYRHLLKVKPGITSWGQVKYGYAENVGEMINRLKFDMLYIENMSLLVDFKILIYTVLIVLQRRGK